MTFGEIKEMAEECVDDTAYDHFAEGESPDPPFLVYRFPGDDNFSADGVPYVKVTGLDFELYTDRKDPPLEERVEQILTSHGIFFRKSETWIGSEKLYEVLYETEVIYHGEEQD